MAPPNGLFRISSYVVFVIVVQLDIVNESLRPKSGYLVASMGASIKKIYDITTINTKMK